DGLVLCVDACHLRLQYAFGQRAADLGDRVAYVVHGAVSRRAELEAHEGEAAPLGDITVDLLNAVHAADRRFDTLGDLGFEFVGRGAGLRDLDDGRGEIDVRRVVDLHAGERDEARQHETDEEDNRPNRVADAPGRNVTEIHELLAFLGSARDLTVGLYFLAGVEERPSRKHDRLIAREARRNRYAEIGRAHV